MVIFGLRYFLLVKFDMVDKVKRYKTTKQKYTKIQSRKIQRYKVEDTKGRDTKIQMKGRKLRFQALQSPY